MIGYASRTGGPNLEALRARGWRLVVSPTGVQSTEGFRYGLDNGAWTAYQQHTQWDADRFHRAALRFGTTADWIVAPDIVAGGIASLRLSLSWLSRLDFCQCMLIAVQDGIEPADVRPYLGCGVGLFVGGTTRWKESSLSRWGNLAATTGCYLHVGRVNTMRRISICAQVQAHSFDGSSASRYGVNLARLERQRRQLGLAHLCGGDHE